MDEISKLMIEQLRDVYSAEKQLTRFAPKIMRKITTPALKEAMQQHAEESEHQIERLDQALEKLGGKSGRKVCEGMRGLIEEAQAEADEHDKGPLLDAVIIGAQQRMEHYEIAAYGTIVALARAAGEAELAELLQQTLEEEKRADERLTQVGEQEVNRAAISSVRGEEGSEHEADEDEEGEDEEEEDAPKPAARRKAPAAQAKPAKR